MQDKTTEIFRDAPVPKAVISNVVPSIIGIGIIAMAVIFIFAAGVLAIGVPASLNSILMSLSNIIVNNIMIDYGDMTVAGLGVAMKVNMIVVMLLIGLGTSIQPVLGCYCGAGPLVHSASFFTISQHPVLPHQDTVSGSDFPVIQQMTFHVSL